MISPNKNQIIHILSPLLINHTYVSTLIKSQKWEIGKPDALASYCYQVCAKFGKVYLSDSGKACALVMFPHQSKLSLYSIWLNIKLILQTVGISNILQFTKAKMLIKAIRDEVPMFYIYFIGVDCNMQGRGFGTELLKELISESESMKLPIYLETSSVKSRNWYRKMGFMVYYEIYMGQWLFFMKRSFREA